MGEPLKIDLPAYVPLLKDDSGPIVIGTADQRLLPLLTSPSKFQTFLRNFNIQDCCVAELASPEQLVEFFRTYEQRGGKPFDGLVAVDLIEPKQFEIRTISVTSLIFQFAMVS
jgi:hypothetical protein